MKTVILLATATLAALAPLARSPASSPVVEDFPGWPSQMEGRVLRPEPLAPEDVFFARGFPGRIARFTDGQRHIVVRWVTAPTRQLHPAAHCFRAAGYTVVPAPLRRNADGRLAACFDAKRDGKRLRVCEAIDGTDGQTWTDVSAWYWSALIAPPRESWWSLTFVEPIDAED